jgi:hypothetical protein
MTSKADFTEEEWARLGRAPLVAGMAISIADPGGPIETIKESTAALRTVIEAAQGDGQGAFVKALAADVAEQARHRHNPLAGFTARGRDAILDELRAVNALLEAKATPEEIEQYREWVKSAAQGAALAAKEGGFLGIGAERGRAREQQMLDTLAEIFHGAG